MSILNAEEKQKRIKKVTTDKYIEDKNKRLNIT